MNKESFIERMREARAVQARENLDQAARDANCLAIISFGRAKDLAFSRSSATLEEQAHLAGCEQCGLRIAAYERAKHPSRLQLLRTVLGRAAEADQQVLETHLSACTSCRQRIGTPTLVAIRATVQSGRASIEWAARILSVPEQHHQLPALQVRYAGKDDESAAFRAFFEHGAISVRLAQHSTRLSIGVAAKSSETSLRAVTVEITGAGKVRSVRVPLILREGVLVGGAELEDFHELLTSNGELRFTAIPIEPLLEESEAQ